MRSGALSVVAGALGAGLAVGAGLCGCAGGPAVSVAVRRGPISLERVPLCYGGGRAIQTTFCVDAEHRERLFAIFDPPSENPLEERSRLREAVGFMERTAGEQTPTWMDRGKNWNAGPYDQGQMDCVDESTNTDVYLHLFVQLGLVRFHEVLEPRWRQPHIVDTHRTAVIRDRADARVYAVDSWYLDNGEPPYIQELGDWERKVPFGPQP